VGAISGEDGGLEGAEGSGVGLFGGDVASDGDGDDGAGLGAGREEEGGELDEVRSVADQDLREGKER
jgi:hypothetical protein